MRRRAIHQAVNSGGAGHEPAQAAPAPRRNRRPHVRLPQPSAPVGQHMNASPRLQSLPPGPVNLVGHEAHAQQVLIQSTWAYLRRAKAAGYEALVLTVDAPSTPGYHLTCWPKHPPGKASSDSLTTPHGLCSSRACPPRRRTPGPHPGRGWSQRIQRWRPRGGCRARPLPRSGRRRNSPRHRRHQGTRPGRQGRTCRPPCGLRVRQCGCGGCGPRPAPVAGRIAGRHGAVREAPDFGCEPHLYFLTPRDKQD